MLVKNLTGLLVGVLICLAGCALADTKEKQYTLVSPAELAHLRKAAAGGYNKRSKNTLRHMYRAAALNGLTAGWYQGFLDKKEARNLAGIAKELGDLMVEDIKENDN